MKKSKLILCIFLVLSILLTASLAVLAAPIGRPFNDVSKKAWHYNFVYSAYERNLFAGTQEHLFSPNQEMSRGMLVSVLHRMAGAPKAEKVAPFTDVIPGSYYENAVNWGSSVGIVDGMSEQEFAPNMSVSREQMVKILFSYYTLVLNQTPDNLSDCSQFTDVDTISSWAKDQIQWAVGNGIIVGRTKTLLCPQGVSSRAEVATLLMQFRTAFMNDAVQDYKTTTISDSEILSYSNKSEEFWFGKDCDPLNRPAEPQRIQNAYGNKFNLLSIGNAEEKKIYLTFDEGYENGHTPQILDTLRNKNVKAVFFVTLDFVESNPELIRRMINEGHVVGNHSCSHPRKGMPSLSLEKQRADILQLQNLLRDQFGYEMTLFRYPSGIYSEQSLQLINSLGMKSVFWSFGHGDYDVNAQPNQGASLNKLVNHLHPGAVYLLHAISSTNTAILGSFIDTTREQGYHFSLIINK